MPGVISNPTWNMRASMPSIFSSYPGLTIWATGVLFACIHSALAGHSCKSWCYTAGLSPRTYRLAYVCIALFTTALWLGFVRLLPDAPLYQVDGAGRWLLHGVQLFGLWVFWRSLHPIDVAAFLGLRPFPGDVESFVVRGIYRTIRHPMYTGIMLILMAMPVQTLNSLNLYACIGLYFIIGSRFEEQRMRAMHPEYADYIQRVPAFVPRLARRHP